MDARELLWTAGYVADDEAVAALSDGYHSYGELYDTKLALSACLWNLWEQLGIPVCKSRRHHDGEPCFGGGWFVVAAQLPAGQVSFHYKDECWDLFQIPECDRVPWPFDGHAPGDAIGRLKEMSAIASGSF